MTGGIGATEIALRAHVEQPPRQALAVRRRTRGMAHDETGWMHGNQHTKMMDAPFAINAMHGYIRQPPSRIAQRILNGTSGADTHHFIAQRTQCTRTGGLTDPNTFK